MKPTELARLIKLCKRQGVTSLRYQGLVLEFSHNHTAPSDIVISPTEVEPPPQKTSAEEADQMLIEDPVEYERWHAQHQVGDD